MSDTRCTYTYPDGFYQCGSYQFNLHQQGIDQGTLCDVHYWQARMAEMEVTNANLLQANLDCNAWFGALNQDHQIALKALDELARLGALMGGYGNSTGNCIAQAAIAKMID